MEPLIIGLPMSKTVMIVNVPNMRVGRCLGPEGNGSGQGKRVREGRAPQAGRKISSQLSARKEATWSRKKKEGRVGRDEEESACTE
jgi:hypothetical protein